ncbi:MAG: hypothetical protein EWV58_13875 [Microcystis aeruginosa Ma_MB_F_20061100_S19]|nr:MAG: hypothetical protein EWV59_18200 [Microcystis aeruginosa Ma_MB_F_20061100_S19D]TRU13697.1 MAG: hypothetical protein EWV58_13875 [Microcystis aeruginosa Ma_MB_F_20061100_S19]
MGCGVWGVGFYQFSSAQLPNFQGKSPGIFPLITPRRGTFGFQKGLKVLSNKVFRFIQQTLNKGIRLGSILLPALMTLSLGGNV